MTELLKKLAIVGVLAFPLTAMVACEQEGPFERAGEDIDDAADDVNEEVNDGLDEAGDDIREAGDEIEDAADDVDDR